MGKENHKKSLEEKIWENIIEFGFDTEITTLEILKKEGFSVVAQYPFIDSTDKGIRSIDLQCSMHEYDDNKKMSILKNLSLFIECKKSKKEKWVFYTEPKSFYYERFGKDFHLYDLALRKKSMLWQIERPPEIDIMRSSTQRLGLVQTTAFASTTLFHTAEMQVLKAVSFYMKNRYPLGNFDPNVELIIPIIVFEGQIFEYQSNDEIGLVNLFRTLRAIAKDEQKGEKEEEISKEIPIKKAQYIPFISNGIPEDPSPVLVDIVTLEYLPTYLKLKKEEFNKLPGRT